MNQDPYFKVAIGNDIFETGGLLKNLSFSIGEGKKQNVIGFGILDINGYYADKYMSASYQSGGIDLPIDFLKNPEETPVGSDPDTNTGVSVSNSGTVSTGGVFTSKIRAFLDVIARHETAPGESLSLQGYYSNNGVGNNTGFFTEAEATKGFPSSAGSKYNVGRYQFNRGDWGDAKKSDRNIKAYLPPDQDRVAYYKLKYRNVIAFLERNDIKNAIDRASYEWASLPGVNKPKGQYGQVQSGVTLDSLVDYYTERLSFYNSQPAETDLQASRPKDITLSSYRGSDYRVDRVLNNSANVSFYNAGDKTASGDKFNPRVDFTAAHETLPFGTMVKVTWTTSNRSVIVRVNDRGEFVRLGRQLDLSEAAMRALSSPTHDAIAAGIIVCKIEVVLLKSPPSFNIKNNAKTQAAKSIENIKKTDKEIPVAEVSAKGTQITLEATIDRSAIAVFTYLHTGTRHNALVAEYTQFNGQSISWVLNRRVKNTRYSNVTLKGLAQQIARQYNMTLDMDEEGDLIENVAQVSLTDWQFLSKMLDIQNFAMRTVGKTLQIYRITTNDKTKGYTISVGDNIIAINIYDQAQTDAVGSSQKIQHYGGQMSTIVDSDSGGYIKGGTDNKRDAGNGIYTAGVDIPSPQINRVYSNPRPESATVKEFQMEIEMYPSQQDLENITPDTALFIQGSIPFVTGRSWFIESVTYTYEGGVVKSSIRCYIPVQPKAVINEDDNVTNFNSETDGLAGVGSVGSYTIRNPDGSEVNTFEQLRSHWRGSSNYARYINRVGQATGRISHMVGRPSQLVYDFTMYKNGSPNCPTPSPVAGKVIQTGGGYGIVKIQSGDATVRILHMSNIRVKVGDNVLFGTILGTQNAVDAGGASTGIHTHIEANEYIIRRYIQALRSGTFE